MNKETLQEVMSFVTFVSSDLIHKKVESEIQRCQTREGVTPLLFGRWSPFSRVYVLSFPPRVSVVRSAG